MAENDIVGRLKRCEEAFIIKVVNEYKKKLISLCYNYTFNYHDAEDLSQEVFISVYKNINKFRGECSLSTYIYRIAISKCCDYKRKKNIKNFLGGLIFAYEKTNCDFEETNYIRQCILSLSEKLKVPVLLYYYVGLNQTEIANILNISRKSVEGQIYRAKQKIKKELEKGGCMLCGKNGTVLTK